ncbi:hypothetical protein Flexsi_0642 [Flexistipes sinusarabici DSM 4947]|uniref:Metallo-beta-lactamase domain-containing protein n=1 Tax=Flexistipes sinusarabici (strain ATCC 49648 / DSM 4947 / MAS 10) TaxID=717231 RepID=F8E3P6_FLESM|nr:MBL fold metallo-hydrolase [Flexistipes sinusarabici]AEI14319.1 hypothetical protein Flexsi_0642 [Flexistipes sinusarabici DSM 4947]
MPTLNVIDSGSSGNCYHIKRNNMHIFVDIGISRYRVDDVLEENDIKNNKILLFLTHEHNDHISGITPFLNRYKPVVFASEGTADVLKKRGINVSDFYILNKDRIYDFEDISVHPFQIMHDGAEPLGYHFTFDDRSITFATDLGHAPAYIEEYLSVSDIGVLESNYEEELLKNGKYPEYLKKRILSSKGHLSNKEALNIAAKLSGNRIKKLLFAHVSEENNDYGILEKYSKFATKNFGFETSFLRQNCKYGISF